MSMRIHGCVDCQPSETRVRQVRGRIRPSSRGMPVAPADAGASGIGAIAAQAAKTSRSQSTSWRHCSQAATCRSTRPSSSPRRVPLTYHGRSASTAACSDALRGSTRPVMRRPAGSRNARHARTHPGVGARGTTCARLTDGKLLRLCIDRTPATANQNGGRLFHRARPGTFEKHNEGPGVGNRHPIIRIRPDSRTTGRVTAPMPMRDPCRGAPSRWLQTRQEPQRERRAKKRGRRGGRVSVIAGASSRPFAHKRPTELWRLSRWSDCSGSC